MKRHQKDLFTRVVGRIQKKEKKVGETQQEIKSIIARVQFVFCRLLLLTRKIYQQQEFRTCIIQYCNVINKKSFHNRFANILLLNIKFCNNQLCVCVCERRRETASPSSTPPAEQLIRRRRCDVTNRDDCVCCACTFTVGYGCH